jgi:hypothetical protein
MPCDCCRKENQFCRCTKDHCLHCKKCAVHCVCAQMKSPTLDSKGEKSICRGPNCGAVIYWTVTAKGKRMPMNVDGVTPHWATCPDRSKFGNKKAVKS